MLVTRHDPETVSPPVGGYAHGVEVAAARLLFISGEIPERVGGEVPAGFEAQCELVWQNIRAVLAAAGLGFEHLVKVTTYLTHGDQVELNGQIRRRILGDARPALTVVIAQTLESHWLLEIDAIAAA